MVHRGGRGHLGVLPWAYCLMPNHVYLVAVPTGAEGLRLGIAEAHRRYSRRVNVREGWRGHLWQGRFASFVLDERWLWAAVRYVENNPVRAGLARRAEAWRWSSAAAHVAGHDDELVAVGPMLERLGPTDGTWRKYLRGDTPADVAERLWRHESTGRPLGSDAFVEALEQSLGRPLRPRKRGPKPKTKEN